MVTNYDNLCMRITRRHSLIFAHIRHCRVWRPDEALSYRVCHLGWCRCGFWTCTSLSERPRDSIRPPSVKPLAFCRLTHSGRRRCMKNSHLGTMFVTENSRYGRFNIVVKKCFAANQSYQKEYLSTYSNLNIITVYIQNDLGSIRSVLT